MEYRPYTHDRRVKEPNDVCPIVFAVLIENILIAINVNKAYSNCRKTMHSKDNDANYQHIIVKLSKHY